MRRSMNRRMAKYWKEHPEKTINCGIQEANMIGVAAGMSGISILLKNTFGTFASRRVDGSGICIRCIKLNVRIIDLIQDHSILKRGTYVTWKIRGMMRADPNYDHRTNRLCGCLQISSDDKKICMVSFIIDFLRNVRKSMRDICI